MVVNPQLNDDVQVLKKCLGHSSILLVPALIYKFGRTRHLSLGRLIKSQAQESYYWPRAESLAISAIH